MNLGPMVASPMSPEAWKGVRGLSEQLVETAGGNFRLMGETPDTLEARTSLYTPCPAFESAQVDALAKELEGGYPAMVRQMQEGGRGIIAAKMAADLQDGRNIAINMNHASLIRSGVAFRLICRALEDQGVSFDRAIIGGAALINLEVKLDTDNSPQAGFMPAYDAMGLIADHFFVSVPDTERASKFRESHKEEVSEHNVQMKEKLQELLESEEGVLLLILGSGTHDKPDEKDPEVIQMAPISDGTSEMIIENRIRVVQAAVADITGRPMGFYLLSGPARLSSVGQMHREMGRTARLLTDNTPGFYYNYQGLTPRRNTS